MPLGGPLAVARSAVCSPIRSPVRRAVARRSPAFDPDAAAYFTRVEADDGTVVDKALTNTLVLALKEIGAWDLGVAGFVTVGGVKLRDGTHIAKDYSLFGSSHDSAQTVESRQPAWTAAALNGQPAITYSTTEDIWLQGPAIKPAEMLLVGVRRFLTPSGNNVGRQVSYVETASAAGFTESKGWRFDNFNGDSRFGVAPSGGSPGFVSAANTSDAWQVQTGIKIAGGRSLRLQGSQIASDSQAGVIDYGSGVSEVLKTTYGRQHTSGGAMPSLTAGFYGDRAAILAFDISGMELAAAITMAEAVEAAVDDIYAVLP